MTTPLGNHSIAELADLLRAKDPLIPDLEKQYNTFHTTWTLTDPTSDAAFSRDLGALKARYAAATAGLQAVIGATWHSFMDTKTSAEPQYTKVLAALQKQSGVVSRGDLQDLWNRLQNAVNANEAARGQPLTKLYEPGSAAIQPRIDSDWAENRIRTTSPVDKPIDTGWVTGGTGATGAPTPSAPPQAPPDEPWPWGKIVAALLGILGVGVIVAGRRSANVTGGATRSALPPRQNGAARAMEKQQS